MYVLAIDDDPEIRAVVTEALQDEGYEASAAADGETALDLIAERRPDLVLLDLQMPGMSGWQLQSWLRALDPAIPVVFMTAGDRAQAEAEAHGAAGYLAKPFDLPGLFEAIERFARRPAEKQPRTSWSAFTAGLDPAQRTALEARLSCGRLYASRAAQGAGDDRDVADIARYVEAAISCLTEVRSLLGGANMATRHRD